MMLLSRLISILLLALFGLPFVSPLFAVGQQPGARLPACCRRNGQHHCAAGMGEMAQLSAHRPQLQNTPAKCPYRSAFLVAAPPPVLAPSIGAVISAPPISRSAVSVPLERTRRTSHDRSCPKRGPPAIQPA